MPEVRFRLDEEDHKVLSERARERELKASAYARSLMLMKMREAPCSECRSHRTDGAGSTGGN
jgi:hypothetical protein